MKETIMKCDHCEKEINERDDYIDKVICDFGINIVCDLCNSCHEELTQIVREFCSY